MGQIWVNNSLPNAIVLNHHIANKRVREGRAVGLIGGGVGAIGTLTLVLSIYISPHILHVASLMENGVVD